MLLSSWAPSTSCGVPPGREVTMSSRFSSEFAPRFVSVARVAGAASLVVAIAALVSMQIGSVPARAGSSTQAAGAPKAAADPEIPEATRVALEKVMTAKVTALLDEKNDEGAPFKRGTFSRRF